MEPKHEFDTIGELLEALAPYISARALAAFPCPMLPISFRVSSCAALRFSTLFTAKVISSES